MSMLSETARIQDEEVEALKIAQAIYMDDFEKEEVPPSTVWKVPVKEHGFKLHLSADSEEFQQLVSVILHVRLPTSYPRQVPILRLEKVKGLSDEQLNSLQALLVSTAAASKGQEMIFTLATLVREQLTQKNSAIRGVRQASGWDQMLTRQDEEKREEEERMKQEQNKAEIDAEAEELERKRELEDELQKKQARLARERQKSKQTLTKSIPSFLGVGGSSSSVRKAYRIENVMKLVMYKKGPVSVLFLAKPANHTGENDSQQPLLIVKEIHSNNQYYAANPGLSKLNGLVEAAEVMKELYHPNIQSIHDAKIQRVSKDEVVIQLLMDFCGGGSMQSLLRRSGSLSLSVFRKFARALVSGVHFLHQLEKSHNDINTNNILFSQSDDVLLGGSCYSRLLKELHRIEPLDSNLDVPDFSSGWLPPERSGTSGLDGQTSDIWCLGRTFCEMLYGPRLFLDFESCTEFLRQGVKFVPPGVLSLLRSMLEIDPDRRPESSSLFQHPFLRDEEVDIPITPKPDTYTPQDLKIVEATSPGHLLNSDEAVFTQSQSKSLFEFSASTHSRFRADFDEIEFLGKGGFGAVVKVRNKVDGRFYAVKRILLARNSSRRILREVQTISRLQHSFVVRYYQAWFEEVDGSPTQMDIEISDDEDATSDEDDDETDTHEESDWLASRDSSYLLSMSKRSPVSSSNDSDTHQLCLYIQMEYCEKKTLADVIQIGLDDEEAWRLFRQILEGLSHVHSQGMIHRDLKPTNIFLDGNGNVKIGDFGLAMEFQGDGFFPRRFDFFVDESKDQSDVGTPIYVAPEIVAKAGKYTAMVDMYSLGICFLEMCYPMSTGMQRALCLRDIRLPEIKFPDDFDFRRKGDQAQIIRMLVNHNPKERPTCGDLLNSKLLPPLMEEEYFAEALRIIVNRTHTLHYSRLIDSIFGQNANKSKALSFDYNGTTPIVGGAEGLDIMAIIGSVREQIEKVFQRHGAMELSSSLLLPKTDFYKGSNKKLAEFIDTSGNVVQLPYDLTMPFARFASRVSPNITRLKRYAFERVYRKSISGGQPRQIYECDFDIVHRIDGNMIPDAEVIIAIMNALESFPELQSDTLEITVNHFHLLNSVLNRCSFPSSSDQRQKAFLLLEQLDKPLSFSQLAVQLASTVGISAPHIQLLELFNFSGPLTESAERLSSLLKEHAHTSTVKSAISQLLVLQSHLSSFNLKTTIHLSPLLAYNTQYYRNGMMFQIATVAKKKLDVLAAGGRYDALLQEIRNPFTPSHQNVLAVGANIAVQKIIYALVSSQSRFLRPWFHFKPDTEAQELQHNRKIDVLICSYAKGLQALHERMTLASECWNARISADFLYHDPTSLPQVVQNAGMKGYNFCVMIKQKGKDGYLVKVRNVLAKTEIEVSRSDTVNYLQEQIQIGQHVGPGSEIVPEQVPETIRSAANSLHDGHINVMPPASKAKAQKHKQKVMIIEKASHSVDAALKTMAKSSVLAVDLNERVLQRLAALGSRLLEEDSLNKHLTDIVESLPGTMKEYLNQIRRALLKLREENHVFVWLYSTIDGTSVACQVQTKV